MLQLRDLMATLDGEGAVEELPASQESKDGDTLPLHSSSKSSKGVTQVDTLEKQLRSWFPFSYVSVWYHDKVAKRFVYCVLCWSLPYKSVTAGERCLLFHWWRGKLIVINLCNFFVKKNLLVYKDLEFLKGSSLCTFGDFKSFKAEPIKEASNIFLGRVCIWMGSFLI